MPQSRHQAPAQVARRQRFAFDQTQTISLSGFIGDVDHRMDVPKHLFDEELLIENGTSALHQMNGMPAPKLRDALYLRLR